MRTPPLPTWSITPRRSSHSDEASVEAVQGGGIAGRKDRLMSFDITPETERLAREEIRNDHFRSVDEMIVSGIHRLAREA